MFALACGVAASIRAGLGVSPVSLLPYVAAEITGASMGAATAAVMALLVFAQALLLRRKFRLARLLQLVSSAVFGYFVDLAMLLFWQPDGRAVRAGLLLLGIFLIAAGIAAMMETGLAPLPFESMVAAVAEVTGRRFHAVKIAMDSAFAASALLLSLAFLGEARGLGAGTVLAALLVGRLLPPCARLLALARRAGKQGGAA